MKLHAEVESFLLNVQYFAQHPYKRMISETVVAYKHFLITRYLCTYSDPLATKSSCDSIDKFEALLVFVSKEIENR